VAGAAIYIVADGFGKAALFGVAGILQHRRRRVSESRLRSFGPGLPATAAVCLLGALSFAAMPPFGTFLGKSLLEEGLNATGFGWAIAVLIATSALTGGAVLRLAGSAFLGLGERGTAPTTTRVEEEAEEEGGPHRTPGVMFVPTALLIMAALALGVMPGVAEAVQGAADRFMDGPAYASTVIRGAASPALVAAPNYSAATSAYVYSVISLLGAVAVAAIGLFGHRVRTGALRAASTAGTRALSPIRSAHSGHIGDYVAWLVAGVALLGGAFAIALQ